MNRIRVEGQDWYVESVREDGNKLVVTVKGGQEITCGGATAATVRTALKQVEIAKQALVAKPVEIKAASKRKKWSRRE